MPSYPKYPPQNVGGELPPRNLLYPASDIAVTNAINPHYRAYADSRSRRLAGLGDDSVDAYMPEQPVSFDTDKAEAHAFPNELRTLAALEDVQGNGVFDASGTHGNAHPDEGVFADRVGLPGYVARERSYEPSEVIDATTGQPVMYVPAGSPALNPAELQTLRETMAYDEARGALPSALPGVPPISTLTPFEDVRSVGPAERAMAGIEEERASRNHYLAWGAVVGIAGAIFIGTLVKKGKRR